MNMSRANEVASQCGLDAVVEQEVVAIEESGVSYTAYAAEIRCFLAAYNPEWNLGDDFEEAVVYYLEARGLVA